MQRNGEADTINTTDYDNSLGDCIDIDVNWCPNIFIIATATTTNLDVH
jgi:hypothetical protein